MGLRNELVSTINGKSLSLKEVRWRRAVYFIPKISLILGILHFILLKLGIFPFIYFQKLPIIEYESKINGLVSLNCVSLMIVCNISFMLGMFGMISYAIISTTTRQLNRKQKIQASCSLFIAAMAIIILTSLGLYAYDRPRASMGDGSLEFLFLVTAPSLNAISGILIGAVSLVYARLRSDNNGSN